MERTVIRWMPTDGRSNGVYHQTRSHVFKTLCSFNAATELFACKCSLTKKFAYMSRSNHCIYFYSATSQCSKNSVDGASNPVCKRPVQCKRWDKTIRCQFTTENQRETTSLHLLQILDDAAQRRWEFAEFDCFHNQRLHHWKIHICSRSPLLAKTLKVCYKVKQRLNYSCKGKT